MEVTLYNLSETENPLSLPMAGKVKLMVCWCSPLLLAATSVVNPDETGRRGADQSHDRRVRNAWSGSVKALSFLKENKVRCCRQQCRGNGILIKENRTALAKLAQALLKPRQPG